MPKVKITKEFIEQQSEKFVLEVGDSWYMAIDRVKNQIAWLEHVPESELNVDERDMVVLGCRALFITLRALNEKYNS